MKKLYTILLLFSAYLIVGCKNDPAVIPSNLQDPALVGKWYLKSITVETIVTPTDGSDSEESSVTYNEGLTDKDYFDFKADNSATYSSATLGKSYTGYYSARSDMSPELVTFKSANFSLSLYIESLTSNELVLYSTDSVTDDAATTVINNTYTYTH